MPTYPLIAPLGRSRSPPRRRPSPIPTAGWRTGRAPRPRQWTERRTRSPRPYLAAVPGRERIRAPPGASCWPSACSACRRRCAAATSISGATDGRTSRCSTGAMASRGETASPSIPTRSNAGGHDRPRLVLPQRGRPPPGLRPLGERERGERAPGAGGGHWAGAARPDPPHAGRLAGLAPRHHRLLLHSLSRAGGGARRARSTTTAPSTSIASAPIPPATRWSSSPPRRSTGPAWASRPTGAGW